METLTGGAIRAPVSRNTRLIRRDGGPSASWHPERGPATRLPPATVAGDWRLSAVVCPLNRPGRRREAELLAGLGAVELGGHVRVELEQFTVGDRSP